MSDQTLDDLKQNADMDRVTDDNREQLFERMKDPYLKNLKFYQ
ncbi:MAG TPA: hypothetical protein VJ767_03180 [Nitrososphaeraceae archaeon]|nr:hypothetical protein [Nitrososphaeraceae archaeon]